MRPILTGFIILLSWEALSQPIEMHKTFSGAYFQYDTLYLSNKQVRNLLSADPQSSREFKIAVRSGNISGILGFTGSLLLAIPVITAIGGGHPEWPMALGGAGLISVTIPLSRGYKRHAQAALEGYNRRQQILVKTRIYLTGNRLVFEF